MSGDEPVPLQEEREPGHAELPGDAPSGSPERGVGRISLEEVIRPAAIAGMLTCIAISLAQLVRTFAPGWPGSLFVVLTFLVSLESIHAHRLLSRVGRSREDRLRLRFVEWVAILMIVRFGVYLSYGADRLVADMSSWSMRLGSFFDLGFVLNSLLMLGFWAVALVLSRAVRELEASPIEKMPSVTDPGYYLRSTMPRHGRIDRQARLNRISGVFFWGGAVLLLLAGLSRVDMRELVVLEHSRSSGIILNVLAYFLIGFLIISQAQYAILTANWELRGIPILPGLGRRWALLALAFLALVGLVSALLPVSYSVGVLDALYSAVGWIAYTLARVGFLLLFAISYIIGLLMSLVTGKPSSAPPMPSQSPLTAPPPPSPVVTGPSPWWQLVRSLIFWTVLLSVVAYSFLHFVRDRWGLFQGVSLGRLLAWLVGLWRGIRTGARHTVRLIRREVARRLASGQPRPGARGWRYVSLRRLSPRERVRYFYLSVLHRSARQGFGRPPWMTPLEYDEKLSEELPAAAGEVDRLSLAFMEARYSEHEITSEECGRTKAVWRKVRRALALRRRRPPAGEREAPAGAADSSP